MQRQLVILQDLKPVQHLLDIHLALIHLVLLLVFLLVRFLLILLSDSALSPVVL